MNRGFNVAFGISFLRSLLAGRRMEAAASRQNDQSAGSDKGMVQYPGLPLRAIVYVIGDLHGRADLLARAHDAIDRDMALHPEADRRFFEIYLGDYIDRGAQSCQVLDMLIARSELHQTGFLRGNHEDIFWRVLQGEDVLDAWLALGGTETLMSYGVDIQQFAQLDRRWAGRSLSTIVPEAHRKFLSSLRDSIDFSPYYFVHAGIRPNTPLAEQSFEDLLWIRNEFLDSTVTHERIIVHGHTPVRQIEFHANRINLDTGAYATGNLSCLRIDEAGLSTLQV